MLLWTRSWSALWLDSLDLRFWVQLPPQSKNFRFFFFTFHIFLQLTLLWWVLDFSNFWFVIIVFLIFDSSYNVLFVPVFVIPWYFFVIAVKSFHKTLLTTYIYESWWTSFVAPDLQLAMSRSASLSTTESTPRRASSRSKKTPVLFVAECATGRVST